MLLMLFDLDDYMLYVLDRNLKRRCNSKLWGCMASRGILRFAKVEAIQGKVDTTSSAPGLTILVKPTHKINTISKTTKINKIIDIGKSQNHKDISKYSQLCEICNISKLVRNDKN